MAFKRSTKAEIENKIARILLFVVIFTTSCIFIFNSVFAATGLSIPVEIIWNDESATARPAQIVLHLRNATTGAEIGSQILTSANLAPNSTNRWIYTFNVANHNPGDTYEVYEDAVNGYTTTGPIQPTIDDSSPSVYGWTALDSSQLEHGKNTYLSDYTFALIKRNDAYILWTLTNFTGDDYNSILSSINNNYGSNITIAEYVTGTTGKASNYNLTFSYSSSNRLTIKISGSGDAQEGFVGTIGTSTSSVATLTNAEIGATHTLTVHHIYDDGAEFAPDVITTYNDGDQYTASPIENDEYEYELQGGAATGTITTDLELTYTYYLINYYAPDISVVIPSEPDYYRVGDIVPFEVTVTNTANYPITDVHIAELMQDATFISGTGYTLASDQEAIIASIPANSSIKLYAQYEIIRDLTASYSNSFEITSASADDHYYLDETQQYIAEDIFNVRGWQDDPVPTGVNSNGTTFYSFLTLMGALGIGMSVVIKYRKKLKERER